MKYSPQLNIRSAYNFQSSLIKIEEYINFAKQNNFSYAFYSELNTMFGVAEFINLAIKNNIKPIVGLSLEQNNKTIILIAKNKNGLKQLNFISSDINIANEDFELSKYDFANLILVTDNKSLTFNNIHSDDIYNENIYLNKISYLDQKDYETYSILNAVKNNLLFEQLSGIKHEHYVSDDEVSKLIDVNKFEKIKNEIANKVDIKFEHKKRHLIEYQTPDNMESFDYLKLLCRESLVNYFNKHKFKDQKYIDRLKHELEVIKNMKFENYFLVVWDYVKFAKDNNIMVGPGRGSAAGSLVSFLLNITTIDPIKYDLLFERFLNPERETMPDIDIDFQDDRRDEVIEYLYKKYGTNHVATIVTYQTIGLKSAIRDVGRVLDIDLKIINEISKLIPTTNTILSFQQIIKLSPNLKGYVEKYSDLFDNAKKIMGLPRQTGTHAAGVVLCDVDLRDIVPMRIGYNNIWQTQYDMNYLEDLGLIKMDILGLRNLTTLQDIKSNIKKSKGIDIDFSNIKLNDKQTFLNLQKGNTSGIFQLESPGMTKVVIEMKVNSIDDISVTSALFRPGPQDMIPEYIKRKEQNNNSYLIDPSLKEILEPTYGIIIYQEQVIQMLQKVANFSLAKADIVRRGMSKKDYEKIHLAKNEFLKGAISNGYDEKKAIIIWDWIEKFSDYGFNKSHSIAYSYISYWLAYLKTHYPAEFYCSLLNGVMGNDIKTVQYINEVKQYGIQIISPSVKNVNFNYIGIEKAIICPLVLIKGIGSEFIKKIREVSKQNPNYINSIFDFTSSMINNGLTTNIYKGLVWSNALSIFNINKMTLIENMEQILSFAKFNANATNLDSNLFPELKIYKDDENLSSSMEKEYLGFYLNSHPIEKIRIQLNNKDIKTISNLPDSGYSKILFYISNIKTKIDKNQNTMAFITGTDETGTIDITIFASIFKGIQQQIKIGSIIVADIKTEVYKGKVSASLFKIVNIIQN